ncbi:hypothetical protein Agub_g1665, partial [Astrephomene gubernaculifera]
GQGATEELQAAAPRLAERLLPLCAPEHLGLLAGVYSRAGCFPPALTAALLPAARAAAPRLPPLAVSQLALFAAFGSTPPAPPAPGPTAWGEPAAAAIAGRPGSAPMSGLSAAAV